MKNKIVKIIYSCACAFFLLSSVSVIARSAEYAICKQVIDGDTIELENGTRVRLIGINSPESNERHYLTAFFDLKFKIKGKVIRLEFDPINEEKNHLGKYGRLLAYIYYKDSLINEEIVKDGCAKAYLKYPFDEKMQLRFLKAEKYAREKKLGIWKPAIRNYVLSNENLSEIDKLKFNAEHGDVEAQCKLGKCYYEGNGLSTNYTKAFMWFEKAAEQGNAVAQYYLGKCYDFGEGVINNEYQAIEWYTKAAKQEYVKAQVKLGNYYEFHKSPKLSIYWYDKATKNGHIDAPYWLFYIYLDCNCNIKVPKDNKLAFLYLKKAAYNGNVKAMLKIALIYEKGCTGLNKNHLGINKNNELALHWYQRAADTGNADAQCSLGAFYVNELKNDKLAIYWFKKAALQGCELAEDALFYRYKIIWKKSKHY